MIALSRLKNNEGKVEEGQHLLSNYEIKIMDAIETLSENAQSPLSCGPGKPSIMWGLLKSGFGVTGYFSLQRLQLHLEFFNVTTQA